MEKSFTFIYLLALTFWRLDTIQCQNCVINGTSISTMEDIEVGSAAEPIISELTDPDVVIWSAETENIVGAISAASPHYEYLSGLRWTSRYEYTATAVFPDFIEKERSPYIERNVTFTCEDGLSRQLYFKFYIKDMNNSPPEFVEKSLEFTIKRQPGGEGNETGVVNIDKKIIVRDMDWDFKNANVKIMTTHNIFSATIDKDTTVPIQQGHEFNVKLLVTWQYAELGKYSFDIISDDGRFARNLPVSVYILP